MPVEQTEIQQIIEKSVTNGLLFDMPTISDSFGDLGAQISLGLMDFAASRSYSLRDAVQTRIDLQREKVAYGTDIRPTLPGTKKPLILREYAASSYTSPKTPGQVDQEVEAFVAERARIARAMKPYEVMAEAYLAGKKNSFIILKRWYNFWN